MIFQLNDDDVMFPDPEFAEPNGLLAVGGDLSPVRLVEAYSMGIFPWYSRKPILWWSLDPRMVLRPEEFRYSKSLRRVVKSGRYEVRVDTNFEAVMRACAGTRREGQHGTWITKEMIAAYVRLHELGLAHSFETYYEGSLVGGLYGVSLGKFFFGESMFHTMTDASKVAFVRLVEYCRFLGIELIDAQQETPHLASLGAHTIPRKTFVEQLQSITIEDTCRMNWGQLGEGIMNNE